MKLSTYETGPEHTFDLWPWLLTLTWLWTLDLTLGLGHLTLSPSHLTLSPGLKVKFEARLASWTHNSKSNATFDLTFDFRIWFWFWFWLLILIPKSNDLIPDSPTAFDLILTLTLTRIKSNWSLAPLLLGSGRFVKLCLETPRFGAHALCSSCWGSCFLVLLKLKTCYSHEGAPKPGSALKDHGLWEHMHI